MHPNARKKGRKLTLLLREERRAKAAEGGCHPLVWAVEEGGYQIRLNYLLWEKGGGRDKMMVII